MNIPTSGEIREKRLKAGMTQSDVASQAGFSQSMIARIEAGTVDPRASTLRRIVAVLNESETSRPSAGDIMTSPVISISSEETIENTVDMMEKYGISQVPVIKNGVPIGCVSESAIIGAMENGTIQHSMKNTIIDIMEEGFPTVPPSEKIEPIVHSLQNHHAVLVMNKGKVVGVITKHDCIRHFS
ncbi:CBS domain-containing protein [Methanogenium marinum]|uniref:CBS domain-containing protein n=1 Tax=Methanogenium marinum TaxID=348610 RepID=A0A9Q4PY23_9EURY|nr:CBS domain-containing protein [Methanogenium marinum]MDE4907107.1 CBS domain-containing protein [Methanogenium marinum]